MSPAESCPPSHELSQFVLGRADNERIDAISQHLGTCRVCRGYLDDLDPCDPLAEGLRRSDDPTMCLSAASANRLAALVERLTTELPTGPDNPSRERPLLQPPDAGTADLGRLGHYRVLSVLGEGGMGVVYQAVDTRLQRTVALKVLKPFWSRTASARRRFLREARACASLAGERIVPIFDVGEEADTPYLAMQLLKGESLEHWLRRQTRLPTAVLLDIIRQIAEGLALAHERGVIHRDLKPANLWVETHEAGLKLRILDFGLARCADQDVALTQSGMVVGTPTYMSPEQANGGTVDARSDLFSLGCIAYRLATGELPFTGKDTLAVFAALASRTPPAPARLNPDLPGTVSALILRLLAKDPAQRPASAPELLGLLERLPTRPRRASRFRVVVLTFVVMLVAGLGLTEAIGVTRLLAMLKRRDTDDPTPAAAPPAPPDAQRIPVVTKVEPPADPREAALWLRSIIRTRVDLRDDRGQPLIVELDQPLPTRPFSVEGFGLGGAAVDQLGDNLADELGRRLRGQRLKQVFLDCNALTTAGFARLVALPEWAEVIHLGLSLKNVDDGLFAHLVRLRQLTGLDLGKCPRLTGKGIGALADCPRFVGLTTLRDTEFTTEAFEELRGLPSLRALNYTVEGPRPRQLAAIQRLKLNTLMLGSGGVTDDVAAGLAEMTTLQRLEIAGNPLTDRGLARLKPLVNLVELNVRGTQVTAAGVADLQQALPKCKINWK